MRLATFEHQGKQKAGLLKDEHTLIDLQAAAGLHSVIDIIAGGNLMLDKCRSVLRAAQAGEIDDALIGMSDAKLLAPIPRPLKNVFCVGSNYRAHVTEASRAQATEDRLPEYPVFFTKPPTAVIGPGDAIRLDPGVSEKLDYEVELGVIIGKAGRNIPAERAADHIFGFTIINDVSARDLQRRHGGQFLKGKGLDTTCPMGPVIVTADELANYENLRIALSVNGETRQDGNTGQMIFAIPRLLQSLSEGLTLEPGDVLATGTPSGVGYAMDPPVYLCDGDVVTCQIEGIGQLTNVVEKSLIAAYVA